MESDTGKAIRSTMQYTEVTRPFMSVGRICDQGLKCFFDNQNALVMDAEGNTVCSFERRGGLYVAEMNLKSPEHFVRQEQ